MGVLVVVVVTDRADATSNGTLNNGVKSADQAVVAVFLTPTAPLMFSRPCLFRGLSIKSLAHTLKPACLLAGACAKYKHFTHLQPSHKKTVTITNIFGFLVFFA